MMEDYRLPRFLQSTQFTDPIWPKVNECAVVVAGAAYTRERASFIQVAAILVYAPQNHCAHEFRDS